MSGHTLTTAPVTAQAPFRFRCISHPTPRPLDASSGLLDVLIGLPGAGKTTFCTTAAERLGERLSLDDARALLGTGPEDQTATPAAVAHVVDEVQRRLRVGRHVTVDATSTTPEERATWLQLANAAGVPAVAYWLTTPLNVALQQNARRTRQVPGEVIAAMAHALAGVTVGGLYVEGFAAVIEVHAGTRGGAR